VLLLPRVNQKAEDYAVLNYLFVGKCVRQTIAYGDTLSIISLASKLCEKFSLEQELRGFVK
jgi:hypothetical protein